MTRGTLCGLVLGSLFLVSCGSKKDTNERNFTEALDSFLAKRGQLCLGITTKWPVDLAQSERGLHTGRAPELAALEKIGLVRSQETEVQQTPLFDTHPVKTRVLRYELTDEGKKFYREKNLQNFPGQKNVQGDLCYGQQAVEKIEKWEGPVTAGDFKQVSVFYTYKIQNLAEWAKAPEIQKAFPGIAGSIEEAGKTVLNHALTLTNRGWETPGLDNP